MCERPFAVPLSGLSYGSGGACLLAEHYCAPVCVRDTVQRFLNESVELSITPGRSLTTIWFGCVALSLVEPH